MGNWVVYRWVDAKLGYGKNTKMWKWNVDMEKLIIFIVVMEYWNYRCSINLILIRDRVQNHYYSSGSGCVINIYSNTN